MVKYGLVTPTSDSGRDTCLKGVVNDLTSLSCWDLGVFERRP